jgi:hypothetical protein
MVGAFNPKVSVKSVCDTVEVVFDVVNTKEPNLYNLMAGIKLPANMKYVAGSAKLNSTYLYGYAPYDDSITAANVTSSGAAGDSVVLNLAQVNTYAITYSSAFFFPGCGLLQINQQLTMVILV